MYHVIRGITVRVRLNHRCVSSYLIHIYGLNHPSLVLLSTIYLRKRFLVPKKKEQTLYDDVQRKFSHLNEKNFLIV